MCPGGKWSACIAQTATSLPISSCVAAPLSTRNATYCASARSLPASAQRLNTCSASSSAPDVLSSRARFPVPLSTSFASSSRSTTIASSIAPRSSSNAAKSSPASISPCSASRRSACSLSDTTCPLLEYESIQGGTHLDPPTTVSQSSSDHQPSIAEAVRQPLLERRSRLHPRRTANGCAGSCRSNQPDQDDLHASSTQTKIGDGTRGKRAPIPKP